MRASQIHRRLASLTKALRPTGKRQFTLEELCRHYWDTDKRGFLAFMKKDFPGLRVFADMFEREDSERAARARAADQRHSTARCGRNASAGPPP